MVWLSDLALVLVTFIWGATFSITKVGVEHFDPFLYLAIRFGLAWIILRSVHLILSRRRYTWSEIKLGAGAAFFLCTGFVTQTAALKYTTASKVAFITGLSVVLVPILAIALTKEKPHWTALVGALLSFCGLATLSFEPDLVGWIGFGDLLALACALSFAGHILFVGRYAIWISPVSFSTIQIGFTAFFCAVLGLLRGPLPDFRGFPVSVWWGLAYLAILATMASTLLQTWAQRHTTSTRAAIIFSLEQVIAPVFAYFLLGEALTAKTLIGGALILSGILLAQLGPQMETAPPTETVPQADSESY